MATQNFSIGDLVFAKIRGYPYWPGIVVKPIENLKSSCKRKKFYCIKFFGTKNHSAIHANKIFLYEDHEKRLRDHPKSPEFLTALKEMEEFRKGDVPEVSPWRYCEAIPYIVLNKDHITPSFFQIGFLGLSEKGTFIFMHLLKTRNDVIFYDENEEKVVHFTGVGAEPALSPSHLVEKADLTFCFIEGEDELNELLLGDCSLLKRMKPLRSLVLMSGITIPPLYNLEERVHNKGGKYLQVWLKGSCRDAEKGTLAAMAVGDKRIYDMCNPCFHAFANRSIYVEKPRNLYDYVTT